MPSLLIETLKTLCALPGVSSREDAVRAFLRKEVAPYAHRIRVDTMGNLLVEKKGRISGSQKLMLAAHMDEVGLMVHTITEEGYLKFGTVGGIDRRVLLGKPVLVGEKQVPGVIGLKAYHLTTAEEAKTVPKLREFYIDIGARNREEAGALVTPGDVVVFDTACLEFGHGFLKAKAIDDRIGCAVMVELLRNPCRWTVPLSLQSRKRWAPEGPSGQRSLLRRTLPWCWRAPPQRIYPGCPGTNGYAPLGKGR